MSIESTRETVLAFMADVSRRGPLERYLAADVIFAAVATGQVLRGREAVARFVRTFNGGAFDARGRLKAVLVGDQQAVAELDLVGRHVGEFMGIAATGRAIAVCCRLAFEVRDGRIVAMVGDLPIALLLAQLGGAPPERAE